MEMTDLINAVANSRTYDEFGKKPDVRVMEALRRVDRRNFIPDNEESYSVVAIELINSLKREFMTVHT